LSNLPQQGAGPVIHKDAFTDAVRPAPQITAKIGGDAAPRVNNSTPGFSFRGQKRQLEDGEQLESKKLDINDRRVQGPRPGWD
uniref:Uncharacterized protein n=1 Tax=Equus asinus TaxID=9793 RepID=A0A9L0JAY6_EQUAS